MLGNNIRSIICVDVMDRLHLFGFEGDSTYMDLVGPIYGALRRLERVRQK